MLRGQHFEIVFYDPIQMKLFMLSDDMIFRKWRRGRFCDCNRWPSASFSTSSFSEGVRLADKSIRMEGALGSRLSMTFQTCQIPKLRGQYFDMLLNMFYLESYLKDGVARAKIVELPFRLDVFCCSFQNVCLKEEGVLAGTLFMTFQTCNIPKLWGQYFDMLLNILYIVIYLTESVARTKIAE